jgi:serine/threonine protein kinase
MASVIAGIEAGFEPIPGYVLRERIGSGGYGEVWLADAPGGLQKAVKFVYGTVDERAGSELRALQRIRSVHHPFILSVERIEVIENQLIVVTELADGTLLDRFREFQQRGLAGIPRNALLDYLRDTADALDFLCQKHELQHLDVKPANLLLVANRVKVADFGLIKDVQNKSMSLMSGMTPTYASPEMFDGRPGRMSDQYSLAIVYQEMLTGSLPFHGRTTAQLATEHLQKAPDLDSLPVTERPVVAKALSKKPSQRFSSCREFIDQLTQAVQTPTAVPGNSPISKPSSPRHSTKQTPRLSPISSARMAPRTDAVTLRTDFQRAKDYLVLPPLASIHSDEKLAPSYVIGLGGTGAEVILELRARLRQKGCDISANKDFAYSIVDIDESSLRKATNGSTQGSVTLDDVLHLPLRQASEIRDRDQKDFSPLSRRWLYNIPRSGLTEGVRPMAMLATLDNFESLYHHLRSKLDTLMEVHPPGDDQKPIRLYLVGSCHGATGSVLTIELAFMIRQILSELNVHGEIRSIMTAAEGTDSHSVELQAAVGITCLREINHYFQTNGLHPGLPQLGASHIANPPWNNVYLVHGGQLGRASGWRTAIQQIVDFLLVDSFTTLGESLDAVRMESFRDAESDPEAEWQPWLRTFASRNIEYGQKFNPELVVKRSVFHQLFELNSSLCSAETSANEESQSTLKSPDLPAARIVNQQIDLLVSDLFRTKQWTAQSWVRKCMEYLVPVSVSEQEQRETNETPTRKSTFFHQSLTSSAEGGDELASVGIERIAQVLGTSLDASIDAARKLLDDSAGSLVEWLEKVALGTLSNLSRLPLILTSIDRRFRAQIESLNSVTERLSQQRDELTNRLHAEQTLPSSDRQDELAQQEILQQIRSLKFQASIHYTAGRMLSRLQECLVAIGLLWRSKSSQLQVQIAESLEVLSKELKVSYDADGQPREIWGHASRSWTNVRENVSKTTSDVMYSSVIPSFLEAIHKTPTVVVPNVNATFDETSDSNTVQPVVATSTWLQTVLEAGNAVAQATAKAENLITDDNDTNLDTQNGTKFISFDEFLVSADLQNLDVKLLGDDGAVRKLLILPEGELDDSSVDRIKTQFLSGGTVAQLSGFNSSLLYVEGERMDLSMLVNRLWRPDQERNQLAERLHSRNDVEWLSME